MLHYDFLLVPFLFATALSVNGLCKCSLSPSSAVAAFLTSIGGYSHFPIGRTPSYSDYYPRQMTLQQRHGRVMGSRHSDLSPISNVANLAVTRFSGRSNPPLSLSNSIHNDDLILKTPPRRRFRRVPLNRSSSEHRSGLSHLRISDSSSFTQIETPPQSPIDLSTHRPIFDPFSLPPFLE